MSDESISEQMADGAQCSHCGAVFDQDHGYPVLCGECYDTSKFKDRAGLPRAIHKVMGND